MDCPRCGQTLVKGEGKCWMCGFDAASGGAEAVVKVAQPVGLEKQDRFAMPALDWGRIFAAIFVVCIVLILFSVRNIVWSYIPVDTIKGYLTQPSKLVQLPKPPAGAGGGNAAGVQQAIPNNLRVGPDAPASEEINLNEPVELDFKSKSEVFGIRKAYVNQHPELIEGNYTPSDRVFGQIQDGKPWWGLKGQFCNGPGESSIEGLSEETRLLANPFLLLAIDEDTAFVISGGSCFLVYPQPIKLVWNAQEAKARVTYDITRFFREKKMLGVDTGNNIFLPDNYNARDFGFNYVYADPTLSTGVKFPAGSRISAEASELKSYIHSGGSCGYPGGCNNRSPKQDHLYITQPNAPATLYCKLWKNKPTNVEQKADFTYIIDFT